MKNQNELFNYSLTSFEYARDMLKGGYITKESFDEFVQFNDLTWCANWAF